MKRFSVLIHAWLSKTHDWSFCCLTCLLISFCFALMLTAFVFNRVDIWYDLKGEVSRFFEDHAVITASHDFYDFGTMRQTMAAWDAKESHMYNRFFTQKGEREVSNVHNYKAFGTRKNKRNERMLASFCYIYEEMYHPRNWASRGFVREHMDGCTGGRTYICCIHIPL